MTALRHRTIVDPHTLRGLLDEGAVAVFDCSFDLGQPQAGRQAYLAGHVPGALYLDLDEDLSAPAGEGGRHPLPDPETFAARLAALGLDAGQQVVAYDASGGPYAARLWWLLRWLGHNAVAVLDGGLQAWREAGYPLETGDRTSATGNFALVRLDSQPVVEVADVLANLATGGRLVIDARSPERFAGAPNPLDPVAGHIPGARNRYFMDNLDAAGRFKPADRLAAEFSEVMGGQAPERTILQCGSGVTACHNALAMAISGQQGAALYPGSWSQWIKDPARPVEREADTA